MGYDDTAFNNVWKCEPREISYRTLYFIAKQFNDGVGQLAYGDTLNGRHFAEIYRGELLYPDGQSKFPHPWPPPIPPGSAVRL